MRRTALLLLLAAAALAAAGCQTAVLHGLSEQGSNQVIAALQDQGIMASKELDSAEAGTSKVVVPRRDASRVWSVLQEMQFMDAGLGQWRISIRSPLWRPPTDVLETEDFVVVRVEIAGMRDEDFTIELDGRLLSVRGVRPDIRQGAPITRWKSVSVSSASSWKCRPQWRRKKLARFITMVSCS